VTVTLHQGHVLDVLAALPTESVHCVVTSPPYWNLRAYGTEPQVWGGDASHAHAWATGIPGRSMPPRPDHSNGTRLGTYGSQPSTRPMASPPTDLCECGAWRGELGQEPTPELFVEHMVAVFREVRRVLRRDGTLWLNIGDSYAGSGKGPGNQALGRLGQEERQGFANRRTAVTGGLKPKDLVGVPWMLGFALRADGWWLRQDVIWAKPNPMPESVKDRCTRAHEYLFLLTKGERYYFDAEAIREPGPPREIKTPDGWDTTPGAHGTIHRRGRQKGRPNAAVIAGANKRSVWSIATAPFRGAHFATMPPKLVEPCIRAGTSEVGCCPECGAPWARAVERRYVNPGNRTTNGPRSAERRHLAFGTAGYAVRKEARVSTLGWRPTCRHEGEPVPAAVLDPFGGSGTTGMVADRLGRDAVLIDLNPDYVAMQRERVCGDAPMFAHVEAAS
jgi:DNA modification methylase